MWAMVLLEFGFGDVYTTTWGLRNGHTELNPFAAIVLGMGGVEAMIVTKVVVLVFFGAVYLAAPAEYRIGVPIGLLIVGVGAVTWNYWVLVLHGVFGSIAEWIEQGVKPFNAYCQNWSTSRFSRLMTS